LQPGASGCECVDRARRDAQARASPPWFEQGEAVAAEHGAEVEQRVPLGRVAVGDQGMVEQPFEGHPFGRPVRAAEVGEVPLRCGLHEAAIGEVVEADLPGQLEIAPRRLVQRVGHVVPF
jgi:hypothetical protein